MSVISMKQLLEAGVHFGHQTRRWNPKMAPYIFTERNGIYIIDLQKTVKKIDEAYDFMRQIVETGKPILFVGTKKQAQAAIKDEALRAGMFFVNERWLGGMLSIGFFVKSDKRFIGFIEQGKKRYQTGKTSAQHNQKPFSKFIKRSGMSDFFSAKRFFNNV